MYKKIFTLFVATVSLISTNLLQLKAQTNSNKIIVEGSVINGANKMPLRGVRVTYKNLAATITDSAGNFAIKLPIVKALLQFEGDGFQSKEVAVNGNNKLKVVLYDENFNTVFNKIILPTNIVNGTQSPYTVNNVNVNDSWSRYGETPDAYLQGKVAGLNSIRRSGTTNIGASVFLRGINSMYATNQPLIIVDGVIFDNTDVSGSIIANHYNNPLSSIDARDIDNISIIKDATTIYGSKGANGAIIVTTIRAKELGTKIDFAVNGGVNFMPQNIPVMKAADYRIYLSDILKTSGMTDAQIQAQPYMNDNPASADYYATHNETNWQNVVMRNSYTKNIYLKVTGGDDIAKYAISLGFLNNAGLTNKTDIAKYNMRFNGDLNLSRRMTATTNLAFTFSDQNLRDQGISAKTNPLFLALVKAPFLRTNEVSATGIESPILADRDTLNISNPKTIIDKGVGTNKMYRFFGSIGFNYELTNKLKLSSTIGINNNKVRENYFVPRKGVTPDTLFNALGYSRLGTQTNSLFSLYNDTRLTYNTMFNKLSSFTARLGTRYLTHNTEQDYGLGYNSAIDELVSVGNGVNGLRKIGGNIGQSKWVNNYLNADYSYADKYFLAANVAVDGSSKFGKNINSGIKLGNNVFAVFPSVAASWLLSSEKMFANSKIDLLKLRASYGLSGNDDIGNYTAQQTYVSQNLLGMQGLVRNGIANDQLQWEVAKKMNFGTDIAFLKERVQFSIDFYNNKTDKMVVYEPISTASGFDYAISNSGALNTKGIEFATNVRVLNKVNSTWDVSFNIGKYNSKVTQLPTSSIITNFGGASYITQVGSAPNSFYGYNAVKVYTTDAEALVDGVTTKNSDGVLVAFKGGDMKFEDRNGDKVIDDNDKMIIGNPNPDFYGAFNNKVRYKKLTLSALTTFSVGNDIYNYTRNQLEGMSNAYNQTDAVRNRWRNNGQVTNIPKAAWGDPTGNARFSNRFVEDGSYVRLRTLSVAYDININSKFFKNATVYATGNNLVTLTKYKGYDPEFSATESIFGQGVDNTLEPQVRSIQVGFRVGL